MKLVIDRSKEAWKPMQCIMLRSMAVRIIMRKSDITLGTRPVPEPKGRKNKDGKKVSPFFLLSFPLTNFLSFKF